MVAVTAVAFAVGALSLYYGMRALRTRRAVRRLDAGSDGGPNGWRAAGSNDVSHPTDWLEPGDEGPDTADPADGDHSYERGLVLLALGLLCLLFGVVAL